MRKAKRTKASSASERRKAANQRALDAAREQPERALAALHAAGWPDVPPVLLAECLMGGECRAVAAMLRVGPLAVQGFGRVHMLGRAPGEPAGSVSLSPPGGASTLEADTGAATGAAATVTASVAVQSSAAVRDRTRTAALALCEKAARAWHPEPPKRPWLTVAVEAAGMRTAAELNRPDPILPAIRVSAPDPAREDGEQLLAGPGEPGLVESPLPLFPDAGYDLVSVPILEAVSMAAGERAVSSGRGASHELRLLFEGVTATFARLRHGDAATVAWTVEELLAAFYGDGGRLRERPGRPSDWELVRRACVWVSESGVPWRVPSGNVQPWRLMVARSLPGKRPHPTDPVVFDIRLPPGTRSGPTADRERVRAALRRSSVAGRLAIAVPTLAWLPGVTRHPVKGAGGLWRGDPRQYPVLSAADRRWIAFGERDTPETRRVRPPSRVDAAIRKAADAAGAAILDMEAVEVAGKRGWRVVPKGAAEAIRAKASRRP